MAIRDFMGIEIPAFKRFYKDSKKTNTTMKDRCYWAEKENDTYFCDGYMIIRFKNTSKTVQSSRLDTTAIKARFPELVQQFMKITTCKRFTIS